MLNLSITYLFNDPLYSFLHPPLKLGGGGILFLKFGQKGDHEKIAQK